MRCLPRPDLAAFSLLLSTQSAEEPKLGMASSAYPRLDFYLYEEVDGNMINRGANLVVPHEVNVRNECLSIGNNVSALLSIYAASIPEDQVNIIGSIALNLSRLGDVKLYRHANHGVLEFNELGNTTVKDIEDFIKLVESSH